MDEVTAHCAAYDQPNRAYGRVIKIKEKEREEKGEKESKTSIHQLNGICNCMQQRNRILIHAYRHRCHRCHRIS